MKTVVIYHRADFDGIFCKEIARKFLGNEDVEYIGWDFKDPPIPVPAVERIYIMDLPADRVFGFNFNEIGTIPPGPPIIWIDHHKSSIESHPTGIPGYRIDGVAACRLAWQWFSMEAMKDLGMVWLLPKKEKFVDRTVSEPYAVRLAGEYDIWDKRDPDADVFQFGLRSKKLTEMDWSQLLDESLIPNTTVTVSQNICADLLRAGRPLHDYKREQDASVVKCGFLTRFEGLNFLAVNTAHGNSLMFAARDVPETGHDALMKFYFDGTQWVVSLYHANHRTDLDLSQIAVKYGGGGHRGACGFQLPELMDICELLDGIQCEVVEPEIQSNVVQSFEQEIAAAINRRSLENGSNTPDFILAAYLNDALLAFNKAVKHRAYWYGHEKQPQPAAITPACCRSERPDGMVEDLKNHET